jgi:predicted phage terminase large subunit-like protein
MVAEPLTAAERREYVALIEEAERRGLIAPDFGEWIERARPEFRWDAPHFRVMQGTLDQVTGGELLRVIFQLPIRHAKTEHNTISYNAYRLERDPSARLLIISHNQQMAHKFSRAVRRLAVQRGVQVSADRNTAGEWETTAGGGVTALGIGSGTASLNADLITVDDPIGKRADAESDATRGAIWDALTNDVLSRTEPHTPVVLTMSRWHTDDPVGRLLDGQAGPWHLVDLPGRAEDDDALGRGPGHPLWEDERGTEWLDGKLAELGSYGFASLIQGRPRPREGGMFKWDWWQLIDSVPATGLMVRYWDTAGTVDTGDNDPDYTAGALACRMVDGRTALVDVARFRESVAVRDAKMEAMARDDLRLYGGRIRWFVETESGIQGTERTSQLVRRIQNTGMPTYADPRPTKGKTARAEPLASKAEAGNVVLCPGEWRDPFRLEAADFPGGAHDDMVDAAGGADAKLAATNVARVGVLRR